MTETEEQGGYIETAPAYDQNGVTVTRSPMTGHWIATCGHDRQGWRHLDDALTQARDWAERRNWLYRA